MAFGESTTEKTGLTSGRLVSHGYSTPPGVRNRYTGYERDSESGLDYAQARYLNSSHGRFTSVDPLTSSAKPRNPQSLNRYSYALNSPYKFVDPLGLISRFSTACGQFCGATSGTGINRADVFEAVTGMLSASLADEALEAGEADGDAEGNKPKILPPQALIEEATARLVSVAVSREGYEDIKGYLMMTRELSDLWITALVDAFSRGFEVGAAAKAVSGVTVTTDLTEGASASITLGGEADKSGPGGGLTVARGKSASIGTKSFTEKAVKLDIEARVAIASSAMRASGILQDREFNVSTSHGVVTAKTEMGFFNRAFKREGELIYNRGMSMGRANTSGKPAVTDQSTVIINGEQN